MNLIIIFFFQSQIRPSKARMVPVPIYTENKDEPRIDPHLETERLTHLVPFQPVWQFLALTDHCFISSTRTASDYKSYNHSGAD